MPKNNSTTRIIRSFGLFWHKDDVFWGRQKRPGALWGWGLRGHNRKKGIVNFRDQIGVYVLYNSFKPIYAGQAGFADQKQNLLVRLKQHLNDDLANRWDHFSWFGTRWVTSTGELSKPAAAAHPSADVVLDQLEAILIASFEPGSNRQGPKWKGAARYMQERDPRLGPTDSKMLRDIMKKNGLPVTEKLPDEWEKLLNKQQH